MTAFAAGETVVLVSKAVTGQDADGNDVYGETTTTLTHVPVWPRSSSELVQSQDTLITGLTALLPYGTSLTAIDAIEVYGDRYEVDGEPGRFKSGLTGTEAGLLVNLTRVTG